MKKKFAAFSVLAAGTIFVSPLLSPAYAETNQDKLSNIQADLFCKSLCFPSNSD
ncbi:hypothetical protein ACT453_18820 [Bacillus sp. D-CC]